MPKSGLVFLLKKSVFHWGKPYFQRFLSGVFFFVDFPTKPAVVSGKSPTPSLEDPVYVAFAARLAGF